MQNLIPQIKVELRNASQEQKINFLGEVIAATSADSTPHTANPALTHFHLSPAGLGLWARDKLICIATTKFLSESSDAMREATEFPMNFLPADLMTVLLELLSDKIATCESHRKRNIGQKPL